MPRPLVIPTVLQLTTLADVRALIERQLPSDRHDVPAWRYVRKKLDEAARGGKAMDLAVALQIALHSKASNASRSDTAPLSAALGRKS